VVSCVLRCLHLFGEDSRFEFCKHWDGWVNHQIECQKSAPLKFNLDTQKSDLCKELPFYQSISKYHVMSKYIYIHIYLDYPGSMSHNFKGVSTRYMVVVENDWPPSRCAWKLDLLNFIQRNHFQICQLWKMQDVFPTSPENVHVCLGYIYRVKKVTFQNASPQAHSTCWTFQFITAGRWPQNLEKNNSVTSWNLVAAKVQAGIALIPWQCRNPFRYTTPKINMYPQKTTCLKENFIFQPLMFRGYAAASFREGISDCRCFELIEAHSSSLMPFARELAALWGPWSMRKFPPAFWDEMLLIF